MRIGQKNWIETFLAVYSRVRGNCINVGILLEEIGVRANLQERRQEGMWELPNDRSDFTRKQGAPAGHTKETGGIPYPRATNRASRVQTRKRNT